MNENEHINGTQGDATTEGAASGASASMSPAAASGASASTSPAAAAASTAASSAPKPRFTVKPRYTPLPSQVAAAKKRAAEESQAESVALARAGFRAESEDDDGYDPYSDFHDAPERRPLFEENPWD